MKAALCKPDSHRVQQLRTCGLLHKPQNPECVCICVIQKEGTHNPTDVHTQWKYPPPFFLTTLWDPKVTWSKKEKVAHAQALLETTLKLMYDQAAENNLKITPGCIFAGWCHTLSWGMTCGFFFFLSPPPPCFCKPVVCRFRSRCWTS